MQMPSRRIRRAERNPSGKGPAGRPAGPRAVRSGAASEVRRHDARSGALRQGQALHDKLNTVAAVQSTHTEETIAIEVPTLEGLAVTLLAPAAPSADDVERRIAELVYAHTAVRARDLDEPIQLGDEIYVDAVGYAWGELFSSQMDAWLHVATNPLLPGLFEGLVGARVGTHTVIPITLPADYPDEELQGATAAFAVDIKAANARDGRPDETELLARLGYGEDAAGQREAVHAELCEQLATELVNEARRAVLDELYARAPGHIPDSFVQAELQRQFRVLEGEHLARAGVSLEDQNAVFEAFVQDEERRGAVRRRLWEERFLDELVARLGVVDDKGDLLKLVTRLAQPAGLTSSVVLSALRKDSEVEQELVQNLRRTRALERVLERADVTFLPAS